MPSRISTPCKLTTLLALCIFAWYIGSASCHHLEWHFEVSLIEDGEHQHPATTSRAKEAYFSELFSGLSPPQSKALFSSSRRASTINDVFRNWKSAIANQISGRTHGNDIIIILTRRPLTDASGNEASGFAMKGSICTKNNVVLVTDDGVYSAVNKLAKVIVHAIGVDVDGSGAASGCSAHDGHLMGKGNLKLPLDFSRCTKNLFAGALRKLHCLKSRIAHKAGKNIPMPAKMKRSAYCSAFGSSDCDDQGTGSLEHKRPKKYECFVHCCKGLTHMDRKVAPDGLECGDDAFKVYDKRCVNGACVQIR